MGGADLSGIVSLVSTGLGVAKGFGQLGYGIAQGITNKRPTDIKYEIPDEVKQILALAKSKASNPFPEGDLMRRDMSTQLAGSTQRLNEAGGDSGASLGAIADLYGKQLGSYNQLAMQEYGAKNQADAQVSQALGMMGDYQDRKWDFNVRQPYDRALQEFFANRSAATQNIFGGIDAISGAGNNLMQDEDLSNNMSKWFGKKNSKLDSSNIIGGWDSNSYNSGNSFG